MVPDAERGFGPLQARDADARITRVGRWLRATTMDELPQLWSIFRGDMSFVGPRALRPEEIEVNGLGQVVPLEKIPGYEERHRVTPGLTRQGFGLDLRLVALSFWITFLGRWERRGSKV